MLEPKKRKYRKEFRGKMRGKATSGATLAFGDYGLKAMGRAWLTARQIEAARRAIAHHTKRAGKTWIRVFPDKPVSAKESGQKMGSGKGDVKQHVVPIVPGKVLFELSGVTLEVAQEAMRLAGHKLPFKSKFIRRQG